MDVFLFFLVVARLFVGRRGIGVAQIVQYDFNISKLTKEDIHVLNQIISTYICHNYAHKVIYYLNLNPSKLENRKRKYETFYSSNNYAKISYSILIISMNMQQTGFCIKSSAVSFLKVGNQNAKVHHKDQIDYQH